MEVALDANVLFRILISGGEILDLVFDERIHILAPLKLKQEFLEHEQEIIKKSKLSRDEFRLLNSMIFRKITFVSLDKYKDFLPKAKKLLDGHTKDEDFVALCLSKNISLWTYEDLLFKIEIGISTKQISEKLKSHA